MNQTKKILKLLVADFVTEARFEIETTDFSFETLARPN